MIPSPSCSRCRGRDLAFDRCASGAAYTGAVRSLVKLLKFSNARRAAVPLGTLVVAGALRALRGERPGIITAVPLHPLKRLKRGYNQADLLAGIVARRMKIPFRSDLVRRVRYTPSQGASRGRDRRANLRGAFRPRTALRRKEELHVLLVDDVISTATTIDECARALKEGGASRVTAASAAT